MNQQLDIAEKVLLGDEAVALGAIHAGISAAYGYPGTPSTEIMEYLLANKNLHGKPHAAWCANEKTAMEEALGVSFSGKRSLVTMKHVGLNVAADAFINGAIVSIHGGLVVAVADDPGMHSSQNEQDSRYLADFARTICLEPATQQEAYEMTKEAFDLSERFHVPVVIRLVTRLAHSRSVVKIGEAQEENPLSKIPDPASWILLPVNARRQYHELLAEQADMVDYSEHCPHNMVTLNSEWWELGVITTGLGRNYYRENMRDLEQTPSHLHIGAYPLPVEKIRKLVDHVDRVLILEEGNPFLERSLRGLMPTDHIIMGRMSGEVPAEGELTPENARKAMGLEPREGLDLGGFTLPKRPPQLCAGCPHGNAFGVIKEAIAAYDSPMVMSDIGCYTLGALPPYSAIESCVCMGASVGMAKGAAEVGSYPVVAVLGDSTFLHSGVTPLMDAVSSNADMTLIILDNQTTAMTGTQPTLLPSQRLSEIILGMGVNPDHFRVLKAHPKKEAENTQAIRWEIEHHGLSVIIFRRECLEMARKRKQEARNKQ